MNKDQFVRYRALDACFRDAYGKYTMEDLISECEKALKTFHPGAEQVNVSRRTIEKDLYDLQERCNIKFVDARIGHKKIYRYDDTSYSLMNELLTDKSLEQSMLQDVLDTLSMYENVPQYQWLYVFIQDRIHGEGADGTQLISFDNNEELVGMENFGRLMNAVLKKQPLSLEYKPYGKDIRTIRVCPYHLKQYNNRWYLIARTEGYESISNYAIDRIREIKEINIPYIESNIDIVEYYKDVIGVTRLEGTQAEDVLIRVSKTRYNYIRSKKIHHSQEVIMHMSDAESTVVKLHLQVNKELEANILYLGNDAEVLAPESLRNCIREKIKQLNEKYN